MAGARVVVVMIGRVVVANAIMVMEVPTLVLVLAWGRCRWWSCCCMCTC